MSRPDVTRLKSLLWQYKHHLLAGGLILIWCLPYFTTGTKLEWGDFSFFCQGYEAIRIQIMHYHEFPWFNPWVAGGVPLYANPQFGVFSFQTLFVLLFGAPIGLKLALVVYTLLGYASMYILTRRFFKISATTACLVSLAWVFSSFFVAHLPAHFTFAWYMLAPFYVYLALTVRAWRGGLGVGTAFAVMALSAFHNAFFQIGLVCACILLIRLVVGKVPRVQLLGAILTTATTFLVLAGHRIIFTIQNVSDFPRILTDPPLGAAKSVFAVVLPYSVAHPFRFIRYPSSPFGWTETTSSVGVFLTVAAGLGILFLLHSRRERTLSKPLLVMTLGVLLVALIFIVIGAGSVRPWAPYSLIKDLPVFNNMRVSSRWFIWFSFAVLVFVGLVAQHTRKRSFGRYIFYSLLGLGVGELFVMNAGYQAKAFVHAVVAPAQAFSNYQFVQTGTFGESMSLPGGNRISQNDGLMPHFYREYEATLYNTGVIHANDALIDLNTRPTPRCSLAQGCGLVLTPNARLVSWTPGKIVMTRLAPGPIRLDINDSNYFVVNGTRRYGARVAEPYKDFVITAPEKTITIEVKPAVNIGELARSLVHAAQNQ